MFRLAWWNGSSDDQRHDERWRRSNMAPDSRGLCGDHLILRQTSLTDIQNSSSNIDEWHTFACLVRCDESSRVKTSIDSRNKIYAANMIIMIYFRFFLSLFDNNHHHPNEIVEWMNEWVCACPRTNLSRLQCPVRMQSDVRINERNVPFRSAFLRRSSLSSLEARANRFNYSSIYLFDVRARSPSPTIHYIHV